MKKLNLKLIRDIQNIKSQFITVGLVISSGILYMVGSLISYETLLSARDKFYTKQNLANAFHYSQSAPRTILKNIHNLPGIVHIEDRLSEEVSVDFKGEKYPTTANLLSITNILNRVYITKGKIPVRSDEIAINQAFAIANQLDVGSNITVIISGKKNIMNISGIALSPEFVYIYRPGSLLPDDKHYGIFWMDKKAMESITNKEGSFNHLLFEFSFSKESQRIQTWNKIKEILKPYGSLGVQSIDRLPSYSLLNDEFKQLRSTALFLPIVFLSVAAFLLHIVMSRLIAKEREQIATLKAIGLNTLEIGIHYFKLTSIISLSGTIVGLTAGFYLGDFFTDLYGEYFKFPELVTRVPLWIVFLGLLIGFFSGVIGFWFSFKKINLLEPATAMRPPMPDNYQSSLLELWFSIKNPRWIMLMRNLLKNPLRTSLIVIGLSFSVMIMILGTFMKDTISYMMELQFETIQRETLSLSFTVPLNDSILNEISNKKGVLKTEGSRIVPIRIHHSNRFKESTIQGLDNMSELRRVLNENNQSIDIPKDGLLLNKDVAKDLNVKLGDMVFIEVLDGKQNEFSIPVAGLVKEILGQGIYLERKSLNRYLGEGYLINQVYILTDSGNEKKLIEYWKDVPNVSGMSSKTQLVEMFAEILERTMQATSVFILIFTGIIAIGVIYNTAMITLSERLYELGSLRILGFRVDEIFSILAWELFLQILLAIPLGCYLGYELSNAMLTMNDTEGFKLPSVVRPSTYSTAIFFTFLISGISFAIVYRRLKNMDLLSVLKVRE